MTRSRFLAPPPADYDGWYDTARGRWVGRTELALMHRLLQVQPGEHLLDVGCGTGWFTRQFSRTITPFASSTPLAVTGIDLDEAALAFARTRDTQSIYLRGDATALPFADGHFDRVASITALCFVEDWPAAISEMLRVARQRAVIGTLNRDSALWQEKGQNGGSSAYRGAHWHTADELRDALARCGARHITLHSAVFRPEGGLKARLLESLRPSSNLRGSFLVACAQR